MSEHTCHACKKKEFEDRWVCQRCGNVRPVIRYGTIMYGGMIPGTCETCFPEDAKFLNERFAPSYDTPSE